jgi:hypothetical protein
MFRLCFLARDDSRIFSYQWWGIFSRIDRDVDARFREANWLRLDGFKRTSREQRKGRSLKLQTGSRNEGRWLDSNSECFHEKSPHRITTLSCSLGGSRDPLSRPQHAAAACRPCADDFK